MTPRVRVLVVDDSEICRASLRHALESDPSISVVAEAGDGVEALEKVRALGPDLVTMDLQMPRLGGLETIERIMRLKPTPILVITERPRVEGVDMTFASLARGAVDLLSKSRSWQPGSRETEALLERIKHIARHGTPQATPPLSRSARLRRGRPVSVIGIGASTGGPAALAAIVSRLPKGFPVPVLVVQHMDEQFHDGFVEWLSRQAVVPVASARDGEPVARPGVWVAPQGVDLVVDRLRTVRLVPEPGARRHLPAVDSLFSALAQSHGAQAAGVLLTGMGQDGAVGLKAMRERGALTIAQDQATSIIHGMPGAAIALGAAQQILPLGDIASILVDCAKGSTMTDTRTAKKTVLVLDDSPVVLDTVRATLSEVGYEVIAIDNPLVMPSIMRRQRVDLALIDVQMPTVSGDVVVKILSQAGVPGSRVVLLSDLGEQELEARAEACGALGYIKKKSQEHLVSEVARFLELAAPATG
jgi:two-component system chemotaxis response regulator CheB